MAKAAPALPPEPLPEDVEALKAELAAAKDDLARLRESEKMYRVSAEVSGRLVWSTDADGNVIALSRMFPLLTGISDEQALKRHWLDVVHPDDREEVRRRWDHSLATGEPFSAEFRARLADGSYRTALSKALPVRDETGRIVRWYGSSEDVHDERLGEAARREAEERLRESEDLHRYTLELSQQIAWTADPEGRLLSISPRFWKITGLKRGNSVARAIHPDDRALAATRWRDSLARGHPYNGQYRLRMKDGTYRYFRVRAAPRRDKLGNVLRWYGTTEDIHLQRQADFARRDVEERYRLAVQATNDAVWDYDIVNGVVDWSDNAAGIFGASRPLGRTPIDWWDERIHPEDRASVSQSLTEAIQGRTSRWSAAYRFRLDDGSYADMLDRGFIIRAPDGTAIRAVGAMADLTERHRAEAEIRRMQAQLVHVSRLSAMGTMASTLAHELNQPLTAVANFVTGAARMIARSDEADESLVEALDAARNGALRAGEIVRRLRELVSRGTAATRPEYLPKLIEDAGVLGFVDERLLGIEHRTEFDPKAEWVRADRIQIQQVLINLMRNAAEAMQDSAVREVVISTRSRPGGLVEIAVADTGCGLDPQRVDDLFSQFMTTKSGGMGIGLPICRTIVEAHGGKIWAENREGGGAVFRFTLPRAAGEPRP